MTHHKRFLLAALELAKQRRGFCAPNPSVGALAVKNGQIIAQACHHSAGSPHAEILVLDAIAHQGKDVDLYVTLEPCSHWGKTPPCTDAIIKANIRNVYYGYYDPNPLVAQKREHALDEGRILARYIQLDEIDAFYRSYAHWVQTKRPFVSLKLAQSLDGLVGRKGTPRVLLTGKQAQLFTHQQRLQSDIILTSQQTIVADDPALNVRHLKSPISKPLAMLCRQPQLDSHWKIFSTIERLIVFCHQQLPTPPLDCDVEYCFVDDCEEGLKLEQVLDGLGQMGFHDVWVEAGGLLSSALLRQKLVNKAYFLIAPCFIGPHGVPAFKDLPEALFSQAQVNWEQLGRDALCHITF